MEMLTLILAVRYRLKSIKRHWDMRKQIWKSGGRLQQEKGVS